MLLNLTLSHIREVITMATGFRSIEIRIINHSRGTISVAAYSLMGNGAEWIDGERPQAGDTIEITIARLGTLRNRVVAKGSGSN